MQASAGFVSASALGMACGPAFAGLLQTKFKIFNITFNQITLPGWVMTIGWFFYLIWLWFSFREPAHETEDNQTPAASSTGMYPVIYCLVVFFCFLSSYGFVRVKYNRNKSYKFTTINVQNNLLVVSRKLYYVLLDS